MFFEGRKIVLMSNSAWSIANFRSGLISFLISEGASVAVLAPSDAYVGRIKALGAQFFDFSIRTKNKNPLIELMLLVRIYLALRKLNADVFVGYTIKPVIYGALAARMTGAKVINVIAGLGIVFLSSGLTNKIVKVLYKISQKKVSKIFLLNGSDLQVFLRNRLARADQLELLLGEGINTDYFFPVEKKSRHASVIFLLSSRMLIEKGILEFIEAARTIKKTHPEAFFQLLGPCDEDAPTAIRKEELVKLISDGSVDYLGTTTDVRPYIAQSDVVVLPTYYPEGMSRSLMEACSMARPVIASDAPGSRELVVDGVSGLYCQPKNIESLSTKIKTMLELSSSDRVRMGAAARQIMIERFSEDRVIEGYKAAFTELFA